ncbi:MAG TPA: heavy metal-binding domain-containing protein, partial [bacterium]|nr:heavy metal-binding domain-containing protein [bacterium]
MAHSHSSKAIYYCPMHPAYTSDKPGDCPICNMKLVKRKEELPQSGGALPLEPKVMTLTEFKKLKPGQICLLHKCTMGTCLMTVTDDMARMGKCPHCGENLGVIIRDFLPPGYSHVKLSPEKQKLISVQTAPAQKKTVHKNIRLAGKVTLDRELYEAEEAYL